MTRTSEELLFKCRNLSKAYGGNTVLKDIDTDIYRGEIVGFVGENGAGKSTLLKIISGVEPPTAGETEMNGKPYKSSSMLGANKHGIGMVFQEQSLIGNLTIAQNIYRGREARFSAFGLVNWRAMNAAAKDAMASVDIKGISPNKKIWDVNFADRQMVEIAKVLDIVSGATEDRSLILLDEPTTVLLGLLSIRENITVSSLEKIAPRGGVSLKKQNEDASSWVSKVGVRCSGIFQRISNLSGGNAQKAIFARVLDSGCSMLILDHPTRGVDVGSKGEIYSLIRDITERGVSVVLLGDILDECIGMTSRIIVMKDGMITGEFDCSQGHKPAQVEVVQTMM
jgi:ABC-type sugar transport system ATPase subunit